MSVHGTKESLKYEGDCPDHKHHDVLNPSKEAIAITIGK